MQLFEADYNFAQKRKLLQDRKAFDSAAASRIAEETCPEGTHRYLLGISYAPCMTIAVFNTFEEIDQNDACNMHSNTQGIMLSVVTRDAGQHTVHIASSPFLYNEHKAHSSCTTNSSWRNTQISILLGIGGLLASTLGS